MQGASDDVALLQELASLLDVPELSVSIGHELPLPHHQLEEDPLLSGQPEIHKHLLYKETDKPEYGSKPDNVKSGRKREREYRTAFVVKSDVEDLHDGFKWRKYGEKAVKRSPYRRKYYRCSNVKCSVKKRVERAANNPDLVIVTYEGQHNHHNHVLLNGVENAWIVHMPFFSNMDPLASPHFSLPQNHNLASTINQENIVLDALQEDCMTLPPNPSLFRSHMRM